MFSITPQLVSSFTLELKRFSSFPRFLITQRSPKILTPYWLKINARNLYEIAPLHIIMSGHLLARSPPLLGCLCGRAIADTIEIGREL